MLAPLKKKQKKQADVEYDKDSLHANLVELMGDRQIYNEKMRAEKPRPEFHIRAGYPGHMFQFDILDVSTYKAQNNGIRYLANFIDDFSRYVWVQPMKTKDELLQHMPQLLYDFRNTFVENVANVYEKRVEQGRQEEGTERLTPYPEYIYSDKEAVANANKFKELINHEGIQWVTITPGDKLPLQMIERFNYTLRYLISLYQDRSKTLRYIDDLQGIVSLYNHTKNSVLRASPKTIYFGEKQYNDTRKDLPPRIKVGDFVRVRLDVDLFDKKSWTQKWSDEVFQVVGNASPFRFTIQEVGKEVPETESYKPEQLKKINYSDVHEEERKDTLARKKMVEEKEKIKEQKKQERFIREADLKTDLLDMPQEELKRSERARTLTEKMKALQEERNRLKKNKEQK